ncbi:hypothetical protein FJT64_021921 [Amphibalanus amphitrite]|uniref:Peptidase A2 domain-containing protein n=1 Tax=Amphibalanus amphitrite TaxID=1232801 RepID=A0A6A4WSD0_AMPAM|nr:hypothetical protein FJT64_021921 [Amphibalanus amphitrite]
MFTVRTGLGVRRPPLMVPVTLDGQKVEMELDTGATLSVCSDAGFRQLWPCGGSKLEPCSVKLKTYSGEQLPVMGQAAVNVQYGGQAQRLPLIVVDGGGPWLFGRNWLGHIRLDWPSICRVTAETRVQPILDEFADVFKEELGCYRGGEVGIDVDPDVQPPPLHLHGMLQIPDNWPPLPTGCRLLIERLLLAGRLFRRRQG